MKNKLLILSIIIVISILIIVIYKNNTLSTNDTKAIIVVDLTNEENNEKRITDKAKIDNIIKIINKKTKMANDKVIPYENIPHYKLKFLAKKDKNIIEINFFYYKSEDDSLSSWITIKDDDTLYEIDSNSLLNLIES